MLAVVEDTKPMEAEDAKAQSNRPTGSSDSGQGLNATQSSSAPDAVRFVAVKSAVMRGSEHVATAVSKTMAKRIANALNRHKPNSEGV